MPLGAHKAAIMGVAGVSTGDVVLLHDTDYSNASTASITSGIDSTYGEYIFRFYNMNPATNSTNFTFQCSTDGGSNYNTAVTSVNAWAYHNEAGADGTLEYHTSVDLAQGTDFQAISPGVGNGGDESAAGEMHLFNPSSTTYVKHWHSTLTNSSGDSTTYNYRLNSAGYFNTTSAINAVQFKMASGNFDGTIKLWGVK